MKTNSGKMVSIVVPALNEQLTIGEFVEWCKVGLQKAGVKGEILIIDSSADKTAEIAERHGARAIKVPAGGLGQAYIDAMPHIKGDYVIMGDCDLTYDFRDIKSFIDKLDQGYEFVMGTRMRGTIETGAMPVLHRYFGNPITTFILNYIYKSHYSDIHCGIRAIRLDSLKRMNLESSSWEYASEMVLKAAKLKLRTSEVPTNFYKDRKGRVSHHRRIGWFSPWIAGWINLKAMFIYSPDFFLMRPGSFLSAAGLFLIFAANNKYIKIGPVQFSVHGMLLGVTLVVLGYAAIQMGVLSKIVYDFDPKDSLKYKKLFTYDNGVIAGCILMVAGLLSQISFVHEFIQNNFALYEMSKQSILGLLLILIGFQTFTFTLVFNMIINRGKVIRG
ncbi:glycosyltransferase family 2 protein [Candidatus Omnitrophota bacterium]